jgi:hypothetical protein
MRDAIREHGVLEKAVRDIKALLAEGGVSPDEDEDLIVDDLHLWDDLVGTVEAGVAYADW